MNLDKIRYIAFFISLKTASVG